jgi:hypothetical protein
MPSEPPTARLIRILETAPRMPLMRDQVRVYCVDALKLVDAIAGPSTGAPAVATRDEDRMATLEAVRQAVLRAHPIPFTDQVRLPAREAADLADRLRRLATA